VQFSTTEINNNNPPQQQQQQQSQQQSQSAKPTKSDERKGNVQIQINGRHIPQLDMLFSAKRSTLASSFSLGGKGYGSSSNSGGSSNNSSSSGSDGNEPNCRFVVGNGLRPSTETLRSLVEPTRNESWTRGDSDRTVDRPAQKSSSGTVLHPGRNLLRYNLHSKGGIVVATAEAHLYLWKSSDSVIVSDVDGTVTRSDVMGVIDTVVQDKFGAFFFVRVFSRWG
jgi:phosphatidate phosphatase LPIN